MARKYEKRTLCPSLFTGPSKDYERNVDRFIMEKNKIKKKKQMLSQNCTRFEDFSFLPSIYKKVDDDAITVCQFACE